MGPKKRIFVSLAILIVLVGAFYVITNEVTKYSGYSVSETYSDYEKCLMKQQLTLYLNSDDSDSIIKNAGVVDYIQFFKIKNCKTNNSPCLDNDITNFPTWNINGNKIEGELSMSQLTSLTSCKKS
jgi:hypothetical protein